MPNANRHDIQILNGLIQTTIDSADGYREASVEAADPGSRDLYGRRSFERRSIADELQATVRALGGDPAAEGSILAKAQRAFADIKHALIRDEASMMGAVEIAEEAVRARFEKALDDGQISATTRETVRRAFARIRDDGDGAPEFRSRPDRREPDNQPHPH